MRYTFATTDKGEAYELSKAAAAFCAMRDIANDIFRPARKHGYQWPDLATLTDREVELIGILEREFWSILESRGINLMESE